MTNTALSDGLLAALAQLVGYHELQLAAAHAELGPIVAGLDGTTMAPSRTSVAWRGAHEQGGCGCLRGRCGVTAGQLFTSDAEEHLWSTLQDCYQSAGIRDRYVNPPHEVRPDRVPHVGEVDARKKC